MEEVIRKTKTGFIVTSEKGKPLSKPNLSREEAERRLAQVEMFKHLTAKRKKRSRS